MRQHLWGALGVSFLMACGGAPPPATTTPGDAGAPEKPAAAPAPESSSATTTDSAPAKDSEFQIRDSDTAASARGVKDSKIKPSPTEAAMRFFVIDRAEDKPIPGVVISLTAKDGKKYYTEETDAAGYAEVLVPVGQDYDLVYLSLGRRDVSAQVSVKNKPNQNLKLTLRYKKRVPEPKAAAVSENGRKAGFILDGVTFPSGKATILPESFPRLDSVLEYLAHKKSARVVISGHTDNVGKPAANKSLSEKRAQACRDYLIEKGIDGTRIEAVGFGDEQPIAPNDSEEGRQQNRRIEAKEL